MRPPSSQHGADPIANNRDAWTTAAVADACVRLKIPLRAAPSSIQPLAPTMKASGPVLAVQHFGSVDVFLEAFSTAKGGEVLVIDNGGRQDEACIGDLTVLEAQAAGLAGVVVWGLHRDAAQLRVIDFPVFSTGALPVGPQRIESRTRDALARARVGDYDFTGADYVFADADGVLAVPQRDLARVMETALEIQATERRQAEGIRSGRTLRQQIAFDAYLEKRRTDPSLTLRAHLRSVKGSIEE